MNFLDIETGGGWTLWSNSSDIGEIKIFPKEGIVSSDYLSCKGDDYLINSYPLLYNKIGIMYGGSSTTFKTPDLRNRTIFMPSTTTSYGKSTIGKIPNITGTFASFDRKSEIISNGAFYVASRWSAAVKSGSGDDWGTRMKFDASEISSIYTTTNYVEPSSIYCAFYIRAR